MQNEVDQQMPNIYKWIAENPQYCSTNFEALPYKFLGFLNETEGLYCTICPKMESTEMPKMACAEVVMEDTGKQFVCHEIPLQCLLALRDLYSAQQKISEPLPSSANEIQQMFQDLAKTFTQTNSTTNQEENSFIEIMPAKIFFPTEMPSGSNFSLSTSEFPIEILNWTYTNQLSSSDEEIPTGNGFETAKILEDTAFSLNGNLSDNSIFFETPDVIVTSPVNTTNHETTTTKISTKNHVSAKNFTENKLPSSETFMKNGTVFGFEENLFTNPPILVENSSNVTDIEVTYKNNGYTTKYPIPEKSLNPEEEKSSPFSKIISNIFPYLIKEIMKTQSIYAAFRHVPSENVNFVKDAGSTTKHSTKTLRRSTGISTVVPKKSIPPVARAYKIFSPKKPLNFAKILEKSMHWTQKPPHSPPVVFLPIIGEPSFIRWIKHPPFGPPRYLTVQDETSRENTTLRQDSEKLHDGPQTSIPFVMPRAVQQPQSNYVARRWSENPTRYSKLFNTVTEIKNHVFKLHPSIQLVDRNTKNGRKTKKFLIHHSRIKSRGKNLVLHGWSEKKRKGFRSYEMQKFPNFNHEKATETTLLLEPYGKTHNLLKEFSENTFEFGKYQWNMSKIPYMSTKKWIFWPKPRSNTANTHKIPIKLKIQKLSRLEKYGARANMVDISRYDKNFNFSMMIQQLLCHDYHQLCKFWAAHDECRLNPFWMRAKCQRSCDSCGEKSEDLYVPKPVEGCYNHHPLCPFWWFTGECEKNPTWMLENCRLSCFCINEKIFKN